MRVSCFRIPDHPSGEKLAFGKNTARMYRAAGYLVESHNIHLEHEN